jgi:hypothetical protein
MALNQNILSRLSPLFFNSPKTFQNKKRMNHYFLLNFTPFFLLVDKRHVAACRFSKGFPRNLPINRWRQTALAVLRAFASSKGFGVQGIRTF